MFFFFNQGIKVWLNFNNNFFSDLKFKRSFLFSVIPKFHLYLFMSSKVNIFYKIQNVIKKWNLLCINECLLPFKNSDQVILFTFWCQTFYQCMQYLTKSSFLVRNCVIILTLRNLNAWNFGEIKKISVVCHSFSRITFFILIEEH